MKMKEEEGREEERWSRNLESNIVGREEGAVKIMAVVVEDSERRSWREVEAE